MSVPLSVPCQHGLVHRAGESITHMLLLDPEAAAAAAAAAAAEKNFRLAAAAEFLFTLGSFIVQYTAQ